MIDLEASEASLLQEIGITPDMLGAPIFDPDDPRFLEPAVRLILRGSIPRDLMPSIGRAMSRRFAEAPRHYLHDDLLYPIKKALGNGFKWGHGRSQERSLTVEATSGPRGAVVTIQDEGAGFDFAATVTRFRRGEAYFAVGGSGLVHFEASRSRIAWDRGGRRTLIRFLAAHDGVATLSPAEEAEFGAALEANSVRYALVGQIPRFAEPATVELCRIESVDVARKRVVYDVRSKPFPESLESVRHRLVGVLGDLPDPVDGMVLVGALRDPALSLFEAPTGGSGV